MDLIANRATNSVGALKIFPAKTTSGATFSDNGGRDGEVNIQDF